MTFEEYLEHRRVNDGPLFSLDTEQKLAFYKQGYNQHLLSIEDEKYFEPVISSEMEGISGRYRKALHQFMAIDMLDDNQISFLTIPSFYPESSIFLTQSDNGFLLEHTALSSSFWNTIRDEVSAENIERYKYTMLLSVDTGRKLHTILNSAVSEARMPLVSMFTLDGIEYVISMTINGEFVQVSKQSPGSESAPGKIIVLMEQLAQFLIEQNKSGVEGVIKDYTGA